MFGISTTNYVQQLENVYKPAPEYTEEASKADDYSALREISKIGTVTMTTAILATAYFELSSESTILAAFSILFGIS